MKKEPILHPCPKCGTMCNAGHLFCSGCGELQRDTAPKRKCPNPKCGKGTIKPERKFCVKCGTAYETSGQPVPSAA